LYSLGPRGDVAVVLFPAKSEVMEAREEFIVRRVANLTCYELRKGIRADLKYLIAYTYATALDGSPTICEWLRVAWIRLVCPMQIRARANRTAELCSCSIKVWASSHGAASLPCSGPSGFSS
jgi:hypothetical protein